MGAGVWKSCKGRDENFSYFVASNRKRSNQKNGFWELFVHTGHSILFRVHSGPSNWKIQDQCDYITVYLP